MFIEILIAIFAGSCAGIVTGITPGIHINLVSATVVSLLPLLLQYASPFTLIVFIISMSVVHAYLDAIPSIYLGAPSEAESMGVLPGHRMLLRGKGLYALKLTVIGSYFATITSVVLFPLFFAIVYFGYPVIESIIPWFIIIITGYMIFREQKKVWAILVFSLCGVFGLIVMNLPTLSNPLFPLLSGLFGIATLAYSLYDQNNFPKQQDDAEGELSFKVTSKALSSGCFSGFLTAITPALGAGMASVISAQLAPGLGDAGFLLMLGAIGAFNFILSLTSWYAFDQARNGTIIAAQQIINQISLLHIIILLIIILIAGSIGVLLSMSIGRIAQKYIQIVNYRKLVFGIILLIICMTLLLSGWIGLLVLITGTALGLIPAIVKTSRTMAMSCLIIPVVWFFVERML